MLLALKSFMQQIHDNGCYRYEENYANLNEL